MSSAHDVAVAERTEGLHHETRAEHPLWWPIECAAPPEALGTRDFILGAVIAVLVALVLAAFFPGHPRVSSGADLGGRNSNVIADDNFCTTRNSFSIPTEIKHPVPMGSSHATADPVGDKWGARS